eukprot:m.210680 g.210680  ORF g.210680 m.210680 type:complete len:381 (-) comp19015_c0_seq2:121-1263(-)
MIRVILILSVAMAVPSLAIPDSHANKFVGVSESGLEFGSSAIPGVPFKNYVQPNNKSIAYFAAAGMNIVRLPFLWERIQPILNGPLDASYSKLIDELVQYAVEDANISILLDVHNYARYRGSVIGESGGNVTTADFADLWSRLAARYGSSDTAAPILFGLMNEPHGMNTTTVLANANAAIAAIRKAGARNIVTVCGNGYSGAHAWTAGGASSNAAVMGGIVDSADNFVYEMHQYLDADSSGSHSNCTLLNASTAMLAATDWLRDNHHRAILGEWAGANNSDCHTGVDSMLAFLARNADVWDGWVWWAAGPWWGDYMFSLEPNPPCPPTDQPQEVWLRPYIDDSAQHNTAPTDTMAAFKTLVDAASPADIERFRVYLQDEL